MAGQYVTVSTVAPGPERAGPCRYLCGDREVAFDVYALDVTGVLVIGDITLCDTCGARWFCAFCPEIFAADGQAAHRHMLMRHAA
jgi:hypothetical protein